MNFPHCGHLSVTSNSSIGNRDMSNARRPQFGHFIFFFSNVCPPYRISINASQLFSEVVKQKNIVALKRLGIGCLIFKE